MNKHRLGESRKYNADSSDPTPHPQPIYTFKTPNGVIIPAAYNGCDSVIPAPDPSIPAAYNAFDYCFNCCSRTS